MDAAGQLPPLPSAPSAPGPSRLPPTNQQVVFDFTKRKRWADLLVAELTEAVIFVLSASGQVWFCSPAVEELLGWKDEEIVDGDLTEVMNEEDRATFQRQFAESVRTRTELLSYVRLQYKTDNDLYPSMPIMPSAAVSGTVDYSQISARRAAPKEVLFEIKGYAHYVQESEGSPDTSFTGMSSSGSAESPTIDVGTGEVFKCFFAMGRPYPSRSTLSLNGLLELKIENERLQQRLKAVRARVEAQNRSSAKPDGHQQHAFRQASFSYGVPDQLGCDSCLGYPSEERTGNASGSKPRMSTSQEDLDEVGVPRKKTKRSQGPEQHVCVTCGRTDSPEWRKGPTGPKTLCNACGLRWAKTQRREPSLANGDGGDEGRNAA